MTTPPKRTWRTLAGEKALRMVYQAALPRMTTRMTLRPPPVEPPDPPTNISATSRNWLATGQRLKSAVPKPVVVISETTWNEAWRRDSPTSP